MERDALGYVYGVTNPAWPGYTKIGKAANLDRRLSSYQTSDPFRLFEVSWAIQTPDYHLIEIAAHTALEGFRVGNTEWFLIHPEDAFNLIRRIAQ